MPAEAPFRRLTCYPVAQALCGHKIEKHSKAFAAFYDSHAEAEWVSSALLRIEVTRAVARAMPVLLPEARDLLTAFSYISIDDEVVDAAMSEPDRGLRSLDAIHLATAPGRAGAGCSGQL
jgi:predicted nucleic acid-binding protein